MNIDELEKRIWTIGNAIVSFAVFQSLAFAYLLRDSDFAIKFKSCGLAYSAIVTTLVIIGMNCMAVSWLNKKAKLLRERGDVNPDDSIKSIYKIIHLGRIFTVIVFGLLSIVAILAQF